MFHFTKSGFNIYFNLKYLYDADANLNDKYTTNLLFDTWKILYDADSDNWGFVKERFSKDCRYSVKGFWDPAYIYIPYYILSKKHKYEDRRYIKFLTKKDYKKFVKFIKDIIVNSEDSENQKEILELTEVIGKRAKEKVKETTKKLNDSYKEMLSITQKASSNKDIIQSYFDNKDLMLTSTVNSNDSKNYHNFNKVMKHEEVMNYGSVVLNEVPYEVSIKKADAYVNVGSDENPLFTQSINALGYPHTIESMVCHVTKEVYQKGFIYCRLDIWPEKWIRICDIFKKLS